MNMRASAVTHASANAPKPEALAMPKEIIDYEKKMGWGQHHIAWHIERRWDSFVSDKANAAYAKKMGWKKASRQEGDKGNGFDFLVMHRAMIEILTRKFPKDAALFKGWSSPPTDPKDPKNPVPRGTPMAPG